MPDSPGYVSLTRVDGDAALLRAVSFVATRQADDGHFSSDVALLPSMEGSHEERSVYIHSYVVQALSSMYPPTPALAGVLRRARSYLLAAQAESGWWRFYGLDFDEPPDDADDTSVAFAALLNSTRPFPRSLAKGSLRMAY
jgi:hypothetical protein